MYGLTPTLSIRAPRFVDHPQKPFSQLLQPLVVILTRLGQYALDPGAQLRLSPVVSGCRLRAGRVTEVSALEQGSGRRGIERWIVARW